MKTISVALAAHFDQETTTRAWCWKVTRRDGARFGFTTVDIPLLIDGLEYEATTGITPSAIAGNADLAVRNLEAAGLLDSESITEADVVAGLWDGAAVEIFEVNYADLSQGRMELASGTIGNISTGRNSYSAEIRGLGQLLQQPFGEVTSPGCRANFGDARCKYPVETLRIAFTVDTAENLRDFTASELDEGFTGGEATWVTGANAGLRMEIRSVEVDSSGAGVSLVLRMPYTIAAGDTGTAIPGCLKRRDEDCVERYDNIVNFRGEPDLPGNDKVLGAGGLVGGQGE